MAPKLATLLGTKYIYDGVNAELKNVFNSNINGEIDLAGCKFGPICECMLRDYYDKIKFIDSENEYNEMVLELNTKLKKMNAANISSETLRSTFDCESDVIDYIQNLSTKKLYDIKEYSCAPQVTTALVIIITCLRPDILINLGAYTSEIFKQVRLDWLPVRQPHYDEYNEVVGQSILRRQVKAGQIYMPGIGMVEEDIYVVKYNVLPVAFGEERLFESEEFSGVISNAVMNVNKQEKHINKMKDYIEGNRG